MTRATMNNTMIKGVNIQMFIRCAIADHMSESEMDDIRLNRYTDIKITEYLFKRNLNGPTVEIKFEMENFNECPWELTLTLNELGGTIEIVDNSDEFEELRKEYERDIMEMAEMYNSESDEDKNENPPYIRFIKKYQEEKQNLILEFFEDNEDSYEDDLITYINSSNNLVTKRQAFLKGHIESSLICPDLIWIVKRFL